MCDDWETNFQDPKLPDEARSSINVAIGLSNLLIWNKFEQFRTLTVQCQTENYENGPVTCEDLDVFYNMINMEVAELDDRFCYLKKMKDNLWKKLLPEKAVKRRRGRPKKGIYFLSQTVKTHIRLWNKRDLVILPKWVTLSYKRFSSGSGSHFTFT